MKIHKGKKLWIVTHPPTEIQSLIFYKPDYSANSAKSWAIRHKFKAKKVHITKKGSIRIRQHAPGLYKKGSFRTIHLRKKHGMEVLAVIAKRKKSSHKKTR